MKKLLFFCAALTATFTATGQHYYTDSANPDITRHSLRIAPQRVEFVLPEVGGYTVYKADLHTHSIYSDGDCTPEFRVREAWYDGLDVLAITEHVEYRRHEGKMLNFLKGYVPEGTEPVNYNIIAKPADEQGIRSDLNFPVKLAQETAAKYGITIIPGAEITREPIAYGHYNALFTTDNNAIYAADALQSLRNAKAQGALVMHNHPGWRRKSLEHPEFEVAAYGDILVTTKRSSTERFTVTYKGTVGWQSPTDLPETVNALEYRELTNAMNLQDGNAPTYDDESMALYRKNMGKDPDLYPNTDWQDAVLTGSGLSHSHTVSLGIGSERVRMLTTLGYVDQNGIIETTDFQRYTFRNNADVKFNDKLSMKLDLSFSNGDRRSSPYQGTIFNYMNTRSADIPNQFSTGLYNGLGLQGNNPVALMLEGGQNKNNTLRLSGAITLTYEPVEWLSLQGMLAPRYATTNKHNWKKPVTTYQDMEGTATLTSTPYATLTESGSRAFYGNYNFLMTFKKNFSGHDLKLILGAERNTYDYKYLSAYRQVFNYPDYDQIDVGEIENMDNSGHRYEWAIQSYFGRLNYNFKERYLLEANLRIDGSSRFSKSNRWGYFPSVSGAWRISEEPFMENAKHILDGLKIRASYGTLGNQNLAGGDAASYYPTTPNLALGHISMNGTPASLVTLNTLANPDIKWETTTMLDVGVDVTLFSKLNITADWYRKNTDDILMKLDIPAGVGLNAPYQNAGKVRNTGWELSIGYNNRWRDFTFGVQANVSDVKNEIVDMRGKTATSGVLRNQEGYSIGSIYALESLGIIRTQEEADWVNANCPQFKETVQIGDIRYADIDGSNTIDENDKTIVGSTIPRYTYSLNLDFGWKGLRLSMLFQGVGKTDGYLNTYYVMPSNQGGTFRKEHIDFACAANPGGVTPRLTSANKNNWYDSSFWMKSAAYLRLKNIQLGYDLPKSWMRKIGLKSAYVYVNAQNLFTATNFWDGYDPEVGYDGDASGDFDLVKLGSANNYPQVKLVTIGLDLKF